jgi:hypothetical protein
MLCIPHKHLKKLNAHHHVTSAWNVPCSQEIADGVNKSAKVAQAVETGLGQMRDLAMQQATSMIEERANLQTIPNSAKKSNGSSTRQRRQEKGKDHSTDRMEP